MSFPITSYRTAEGRRYMARPMIRGTRKAKGGFETKQEAREWIVTQRQRARTGVSLFERGTVGELLTAARERSTNTRLDRRTDRELSDSSKQAIKQILGWWLVRIGDVRLSDVDRRMWDRWCQLLRDGLDASPGTRRRYLFQLSRAFAWGLEAGELMVNPLAGFRNPFPSSPGRHRILTRGNKDAEWEQIRDYVAQEGREELAWFIWLYLGAGMRRKEIVRVRVRDVDTEQNTVHVLPSKNGKARTLDLPMVASEKYAVLAAGKGPDSGLIEKWPRTAWYAMLKELGITNLRPHDLRHTFGTWMLEDEPDTDVREQMAILGHSTPQMTMRYARWVKGSRSERTRRLQDRMAGSK